MLRYPRWAGFLSLLALTLAFGAACGGEGVEATPAFHGGPRVAFEEEAVDLGRVPLNKVVRHEFRFRNVGDTLLMVRQTTIRVLEGC